MNCEDAFKDFGLYLVRYREVCDKGERAGLDTAVAMLDDARYHVLKELNTEK